MLPGYAAVMTARVARVTLRQLLTMTAGFQDPLNDDALGTASDWVRYILKRQDNTPGKEFHGWPPEIGRASIRPARALAAGQDGASGSNT
jgi:hypothetical protein